jgi:hypothetical protein
MAAMMTTKDRPLGLSGVMAPISAIVGKAQYETTPKQGHRWETQWEMVKSGKKSGLRIYSNPLILLVVVPTGLEPVLPT